MQKYNFFIELSNFLQGGQLSLSFFEKVEKLSSKLTPKYSPSIWEANLIRWTKEVIKEISIDFVVNYLMGDGNNRMQYLLQQVSIARDVDGLMIQMFKQYLGDLTKKRYPHSANLLRRIKGVLQHLEEIEKSESKGTKITKVLYRMCGSKVKSLIEEHELVEESYQLPPWRRIVFDPQSKKICSIISTDDLCRIITSIFDHHLGWIKEDTILSFLSNHLNLYQYEHEISFPYMEERDSWEDWLQDRRAGGEDETHLARLSLQSAISQLTPRQNEIFYLHFLKDHAVSEIAVYFSMKKSTIYSEIELIKKILDNELGK